MFPELNEIKILRKKAGITQQELAENAKVSQALIAKIEAGKVKPSYDKAKRILEALLKEKKEKRIKAKDVATKKIVYLKGNESLEKAVRIMSKKSLSQLPVIRRNKVLGLITEKAILNYIKENKDSMNKTKVREAMEKALPVFNEETDLNVIEDLLAKDLSAVLITKKGKITGIITKSDLIKTIKKR